MLYPLSVCEESDGRPHTFLLRTEEAGSELRQLEKKKKVCCTPTVHTLVNYKRLHAFSLKLFGGRKGDAASPLASSIVARESQTGRMGDVQIGEEQRCLWFCGQGIVSEENSTDSIHEGNLD